MKHEYTVAHSPSYTDVVVCRRWKLIELLGKGGFASVYSAIDRQNRDCPGVAVKVVSRSHAYTHDNEVKALSRIAERLDEKSRLYFPRLYAEGILTNKEPFVVMELCGKSIRDIQKTFPHQRLSLKTALMFGIRALRAIEKLHSIGLVHRDIKPANFVIGRELDSQDQIKLIDFGLAVSYLRSDGTHVPAKEGGFYGSLPFASIRALQGLRPTRKDDLESLWYSILYLMSGRLPWGHLRTRSPDDVAKFKEFRLNLPIQVLVANVPTSLIFFLDKVNKLKYDETPDYEGFVAWLQACLADHGLEDDGVFDWCPEISARRRRFLKRSCQDTARLPQPKRCKVE